MECKEFCSRAKYYIEKEIPEILPNRAEEQKKEKLISDNENDKDEKNNIITLSELADNNKPTQNFVEIVKIEVDGNCFLKTILEANINQSIHKNSENTTQKPLNEKEWDKEYI